MSKIVMGKRPEEILTAEEFDAVADRIYELHGRELTDMEVGTSDYTIYGGFLQSVASEYYTSFVLKAMLLETSHGRLVAPISINTEKLNYFRRKDDEFENAFHPNKTKLETVYLLIESLIEMQIMNSLYFNNNTKKQLIIDEFMGYLLRDFDILIDTDNQYGDEYLDFYSKGFFITDKDREISVDYIKIKDIYKREPLHDEIQEQPIKPVDVNKEINVNEVILGWYDSIMEDYVDSTHSFAVGKISEYTNLSINDIERIIG